MKSLKLIAVLLIVGIALLGTLSVAVASVTRPVNVMPEAAVLSVESGDVEVLFGEGEAWILVSDAVEIHAGDSVRTGANSRAIVNAFNQGELRLDADTEVRFEELSWDSDGVFTGSVMLKTGRLWSRLLDFLAPDSKYEVQTDATVASIRGTAFSMEYGEMGDWLFVDDHLVSVWSKMSQAGEQVGVFSGEKVWSMKMKDTSLPRVVPVPMEARDESWVAWNEQEDQKFMDHVRRVRQEDVRVQRPIDPTSPLYGFVGVAERMRLMVAGEEKTKELKEQFARGRMMDAYAALGSGEGESLRVLAGMMSQYGDVPEEVMSDMMVYWAHGNGRITSEFIGKMAKTHPLSAQVLSDLLARREVFRETEESDATMRDRARSRMMELEALQALPRLHAQEQKQLDALLSSMEGMPAGEMDAMEQGMGNGSMLETDVMMNGDGMMEEDPIVEAPAEEQPVYNIGDYLVPKQDDPALEHPEPIVTDPVEETEPLPESDPIPEEDPNQDPVNDPRYY